MQKFFKTNDLICCKNCEKQLLFCEFSVNLTEILSEYEYEIFKSFSYSKIDI